MKAKLSFIPFLKKKKKILTKSQNCARIAQADTMGVTELSYTGNFKYAGRLSDCKLKERF